MASRPSWVVLAPGRREHVETAVRSAFPVDDDDPDDRLSAPAVVAGSKGYVAVIEMGPGAQCTGEEELALALSRTLPGPVYVLWTDEDYPAAYACEAGQITGDLAEDPDTITVALGCSFPGVSALAGSDSACLTPIPRPKPAADEPRIAGFPTSVWGHQIAVDFDWSAAFDPSPQSAAETLAALAHPSADVRAVAAEIASLHDPSLWRKTGGVAGDTVPEAWRQYLAAVEAACAREGDTRVRAVLEKSVLGLREWLE
jgi:hypothetical protein